MNETELKSNWNKLKGRVKERWGELTDDEVDGIEGKRDQLVGLIQERYSRTKDDALREVNDFLGRVIDRLDSSDEAKPNEQSRNRPSA